MISIDAVIIGIFLSLTILVGFSSKINVTNLREHALGNRDFTTLMLIATVVASWIGGGAFFITLTDTYVEGLHFIFASAGMSLCFLITAFILMPRMGFLLGKISIAEAIGEIYGPKIRFVIAVCGIFASIGSVGVQFKVFSNIMSYFSIFDPMKALIVSGVIVTLYSAYGGIKSVTFTDMLQFIIFILVIPFLCTTIWNDYFDNYNLNLIHAFSNEKFNYETVFDTNNVKFWEMIPLLLYFAIPGMKPYICQRISMGSNLKQLKRVFYISAIFILVSDIALSSIPLFIYSIDSSLDKSQVVGYVLDNYATTGIKGMIVVGVFAMAMSTADSNINISSVLFANDVLYNVKMTEHTRLNISKIFSLSIGVGAIIFALFANDLLQMVLLTASAYMPVVTPVIFLTAFGFRTTKKSILIGMFGGAFTVFLWKYYSLPANPIVVAMSVNIVSVLFFHYIFAQKGGWYEISYITEESETPDDGEPGLIEQIRNFNLREIVEKNFITTPGFTFGLGLYCFISTMIFMTYSGFTKGLGNNDSTDTICLAILFTAVTAMAYPMWADKENVQETPFAVKLYLISVMFFHLTVFNSFFTMYGSFEYILMGLFCINSLLMILLAGHKMGFLLLIIGFTSSSIFYSQTIHNISFLEFISDPNRYAMIFMLIVVWVITSMFLKPQMQRVREAQTEVHVLSCRNRRLSSDNKELMKQNEELEKRREAIKAERDNLTTKNTDLLDKIEDYGKMVNLQNKEIERLKDTAERIICNVNHELRLPVGNVMNFADLLLEEIKNKREQHLEIFSEEIFKNSERLASLIINMLDLASLKCAELELQKVRVNLRDLARYRIERCFRLYREDKNLNINMTMENDIFLDVDNNYIEQVIDNLTKNAIQYTEGGDIDISLKKTDKGAVFSISDKGVGIPHSDFHDVFTPHFVGAKVVSKIEGRGIGLALCKAAVEAHGGSIKMTRDGLGVTFTFILPIN